VNLAAGTTVSVTVHTASGDVECPSYGTISYAEPKDVELEESGELTALYIESGNYVAKGSVIARLKSDSLEKELKAANDAYQDRLDALKDAEDNYENTVAARENQVDGVETAQAELDNAIKAAEDYVITSPVSGVILEKHYKAGDTYGNDDNRKLMVVADMSKMVFTINVDELDISNIQVGQSVNVTADALPGEIIQGTITTVSKIGDAQNGVTGYPVEITITEPGNLMSGMNVTAEIVVGSVNDVLIAPTSAIFLIDGLYYATIVTPPANEGEPETEEQVPVTVGLHNDEFYEIVDGLKEGDILRDSGIGSSSGDDMMYYGW
ncbi:MAG: efflux RND transporter periplasmic adaptor subunit, partial [Clostridia bacterium]